MDLVLFGIQGSGKGTQARKFCAEFGYDLFETGAELRKMAASGTELGNTVKSYIDAGNLAPHEIVMQVVSKAVCDRSQAHHILFDGIPRDLEQMADFDRIMQEAGREFRCVELVIPPMEAHQRILKRIKEENRTDDANEEFVRRRMQIFEQSTKKVIASYESRGLLIRVDGMGTVEDVYERLKNAVSPWLAPVR